MPKCSFCGRDIPKGTGKIYVKKDGKVLYFDRMKCEKNMLKLKRKARHLKWTEFYEKGTHNKKDTKAEKRLKESKEKEKSEEESSEEE